MIPIFNTWHLLRLIQIEETSSITEEIHHVHSGFISNVNIFNAAKFGDFN